MRKFLVILTFLIIVKIAYPNYILGALPGQIIQDPDSPARMIYNGEMVDGRPKAAIPVGPGDPEDFFFFDTQANIDMLISRGARTVYIMAYNRDFCFPDICGPGVNIDETLNQWEVYLTQLENAGIITVFIFFDDQVSPPSGWETVVDKIVNKFEHHKLLIWSVAEEWEYGFADDPSLVHDVATRIKDADDNGHIIAVHQIESSNFAFNDDSVYPNLNMFMAQINVDPNDVVSMHQRVLDAWNNVGGNEILNMAEDVNHAFDTRTTVRQRNWAAVMSGASMVMIHEMGRVSNPPETNDPGKYSDAARLMDFMESTTVNDMAPRDDLKHDGTQWVLADPGNSYIGYAQNLSSNMGFRELIPNSNYSLKWLDPVTGAEVSETKTALSSDQSWTKPQEIGNEAALFIKRIQSAIQGDANGDGSVDGKDYVIWIGNFVPQESSVDLRADFNGDGLVDGIDYVRWWGNYGK